MNPKIEEARINFVLRTWERRQIPFYTPEECIKRALAKHKNVCVSWSGGKCSTAVLHMTLQLKPDIVVLNNDTGVEYPETRQYIKDMTAKWNINLHVSKPITTFWKLVKTHGFPQMRALGIDKKKRPSVPICCKRLKEDVVKGAYKRYMVDADLDGLRVAESRVRMIALAGYGQSYYTKGYKVWRYHPIILWNEKQLNEYYTQHNIPLNPLYLKGFERSGCMPCTAFKNWADNLSKANPKMYAYIMKRMGKPTMDEFLKSGKEMQQIVEEQFVRECDQQIGKDKKGTLLEFM